MLEFLPKELEDYCQAHSGSESAIYRELTLETFAKCEHPQMLSGPIVGAVLQLLVRLVHAENILEIGTFTGYSTLKMAEAQEPGGKVVTCEIDQNSISIARYYFEKVTWGKKITILKGPALQSIADLSSPLDLIFIDADKVNYLNYYQKAIELIRSGGIIILDNALWSGRVVNPEDEATLAIARTNEVIQKDERVWNILLPVRDGLMLVQKK